MTKRLASYRVPAMESPLRATPGESVYAVRAAEMYKHKLRPKKYRDEQHGLCIHTTGSGLPARAHKHGLYPTILAVEHYLGTHGPPYVCGWRGSAGGDLIQLANESVRSNGVGTMEQWKNGKLHKGQRNSERGEYKGSWEKDLPKTLVKRLKAMFPGMKSPLRLLPAAPNSCMVQMEMIPCVYWVGKKKIVGAKPMRKGLKFTEAQHDTVAFLAVDLAERNNWPDGWWLTPRLGTHAMFTPISRSNSGGGWDPGVLRAKPFFDLNYVREVILDLLD